VSGARVVIFLLECGCDSNVVGAANHTTTRPITKASDEQQSPGRPESPAQSVKPVHRRDRDQVKPFKALGSHTCTAAGSGRQRGYNKVKGMSSEMLVASPCSPRSSSYSIPSAETRRKFPLRQILRRDVRIPNLDAKSRRISGTSCETAGAAGSGTRMAGEFLAQRRRQSTSRSQPGPSGARMGVSRSLRTIRPGKSKSKA